MKIAAFVQLQRTIPPLTGVGRHITHMVKGLASCPQFQVSCFCAKEEAGDTAYIQEWSSLAGMPVQPFPMKRWIAEFSWRFLNAPSANRWVGDVDWIYAPADAFIATKYSKLAITCHDLRCLEPDFPWSRSWTTKIDRMRRGSIYQRMAQQADLILTVSEYTKQRIVDILHADPIRIKVVGNGVEQRYFDLGKEPSCPLDSRKRVLMIGALTALKGGHYLFQVAEALFRRRPDLLISIVEKGGDPEFVKKAELMPNIKIFSAPSDVELCQLMRESAALLSLSRYEGFGIPALEAMAAGVPVIVSHFAAFPEVVGDAGIVMDPSKAEEVAHGIDELTQDSEFRKQLIHRGLIHASKYTWENCVIRLKDLFLAN